jgi:hypothetical protein
MPLAKHIAGLLREISKRARARRGLGLQWRGNVQHRGVAIE